MSATDERSETAALEAASAWRARIAEDPGVSASAAFQAWLAQPGNNICFEQVSRTWDALGLIGASPAVLAARQASLHALRRHARGWRIRKQAAAAVAMAAGLVIAVIFGAQFYARSFTFQTYETAAMERRVVVLADGSKASLDADTRLDLRFTPNERHLTLARGQASFAVAHDSQRPFRVATPSRVVTATGTRFNVDLFGAQTIVTLAEGRVVVSHAPGAGGGRAVALLPGQQLVARGESDRVRRADPALASAWERGDVVFDDELLPAAIARFNRYTPRRWRLDPALAGLKVSGVFDTTDPDAFLDVITTYFDIEATVATDGAVVLRPARKHEKKIVATR